MDKATYDHRQNIHHHKDAGTCYLCGKEVLDGQPRHGGTGAHWACAEKFDAEAAKAEALLDEFIGKSTPAPARPRKPEGQGKTAQKALALAKAAIEAELGSEITDLRVWNQQGVYRGPRWDLDAWGFHFAFGYRGVTLSGQASSLSTMSACVAAKKLYARQDGRVIGTFTLWTEPTTKTPKKEPSDGPAS